MGRLLPIIFLLVNCALAQDEKKTVPETPAEESTRRRHVHEPSDIRFVQSLPKLRAEAYENAREGWGGRTAEMRMASYDVIDSLMDAWLNLAEFYPPKHFGEKDARQYVSDYIRDRFAWHWARHEPEGPGTGGTIVGVMTGGNVISDMEEMIAETVGALFVREDDFNLGEWYEQWRNPNPDNYHYPE